MASGEGMLPAQEGWLGWWRHENNRQGTDMTEEAEAESKKPRPLWLNLLIDVVLMVLVLTVFFVILPGTVVPEGRPINAERHIIWDDGIWDYVIFRSPETVLRWWLWTMKWILPFCTAYSVWCRIKGISPWETKKPAPTER